MGIDFIQARKLGINISSILIVCMSSEKYRLTFVCLGYFLSSQFLMETVQCVRFILCGAPVICEKKLNDAMETKQDEDVTDVVIYCKSAPAGNCCFLGCPRIRFIDCCVSGRFYTCNVSSLTSLIL